MQLNLKFHTSAIAFAAACLVGCQHVQPVSQGNEYTTRPVASPVNAGGYHWNFDVSGDQHVRPVQVFSKDDKTWIQLKPQQLMPAVIVAGQPVPFDIAPPFLIVQGSPSHIDLVSANFRAVIVKRVSPAPVLQDRSADGGRVTRVPAAEIPKE